MQFTCTLEAISEETKLAKVILAFTKRGYRIKSQKQDVSPEGKKRIHIEAQTDVEKTRKDIESELSAIEGCRPIDLETSDSDAIISTATDERSVLTKIGQEYPHIDKIVKTHAGSLPKESREEAIREIGIKVGAGIYTRDFSLGSPLPMPAALHRELAVALKEFSEITTTDSSITLTKCPFCATKDGEVSSCEFITGFIKGFLDKNPGTPHSQISETSCGSGRGSQCTFDIQF